MKNFIKTFALSLFILTIFTISVFAQNANLDNNMVNSETKILDWANIFDGETSTTFNYYKTDLHLRYFIKNTGSETFKWTILNPDGKKWASGTLNPEKSIKCIAFCDFDYMPKGQYTLKIVTNNGGAGSAISSINTISD